MNEVVFVGTSDAFGAGGRRQSAVVVRGRRGGMLLDCGATTTTGLNELGIERGEIDTILVSHFHGDHFGGIPHFLLGALYTDRRTEPIEIAGPPDVELRVRQLAAAMGHDLDRNDWTFDIRFTEVRPGRHYSLGPAEIDAFEMAHQLEAHPQGYRVSLGERTVAYSGDTGWFEGLPELSAGADLFVCECTLHHDELDFHLNLDQIVEHREDFDCGDLILTHLGAEMAELRGRCEVETADDGVVKKL